MPSPYSEPSILPAHVLGVRVDCVTRDQALTAIREYLDQDRLRQIVTINPEMLMMARRDAELQDVIEKADLVVADGVGLLIAARLLGLLLRERTTGVDLVPDLCALAAEADCSVYFLGARPGVASKCAAALSERVPDLRVAGTYSGSPAPSEEALIRRRVAAAGTDVLLVAYGVPAEEKWIARNRDRLGVKLAVGVGGAFDFIAGEVPRAPMWMQRAGLEWLFRLSRQPWRWRRMAVLPQFLVRVLAQAVRARLTWPHSNSVRKG